MTKATPSAMCLAFHKLSILLFQGHEAAVGSYAGSSACVSEQHERQQTYHFAVVRKQSPDLAGEPDGFRRQLAPLQVRADDAV